MFLARTCLLELCREDGKRGPLTCDVDTGSCVEIPRRADLPIATGDVVSDSRHEKPDSSTTTLPESMADGGATEADAAPKASTDSSVPTADPCTSNPCQHGGTCVGAGQGFTCSCANGYYGPACEFDVDECAVPGICPADYPCVQTAAPGYTCLGQFADWKMPGPDTPASYDTGTDGIVIDKVSGLVWQRYLPGNAAIQRPLRQVIAPVSSTQPAQP